MSKQDLYDRAAERLRAESGTVIKDPGGKINVALVYPNSYSIGMSSLGFLGVHAMLNARADVYCQRAFLPVGADMDEHLRTGTPLFSIESARQLSDFDVIAFSVSFENDYPGVLRALHMSGIPMRAEQRDARHPLVIMGGVCAFSNPEPLADFIDAFLVGEAEGFLDEFMDTLAGGGGQRAELLKELSAIEGVYVPSLYEIEYSEGDGVISKRIALGGAPERVSRRHVPDIASPGIRQLITTKEAEFSGMRLLEVQRGCPWSCNFCLAGRVFNPPRKKNLDALVSEINESGGQGKVGLVGPSLGDYPHLSEALDVEGVDFTITSLRANRSSAELVLGMPGRRSVSIAPEAGTQRLREYINKKVDHEDILEAAGMIMDGGIKRLKLYFMVGLPTETDEDIDGIIALAKEIRALSKKGSITLTLSPFVPKPFTAFQREPMQKPQVIKSRLRKVKEALRRVPGMSVSHDPVKESIMQGVLAMGDRRVGRVLELMASEGMDYAAAARQGGIETAYYIHRQRPSQEPLPWDFIDC